MHWYLYIGILTGKTTFGRTRCKARRENEIETGNRQTVEQAKTTQIATVYPALPWYLWQPPNCAQTILRLFVCFAHLNCCSFNIHSHAEGSQPTVCPSLSATAVRFPLVSIFKYFPLTDFTIFHFHTFFFFGCRPWPKTQALFFYLLFIHSATASLLMLPSFLCYSAHRALLTAFSYFGSVAIDV